MSVIPYILHIKKTVTTVDTFQTMYSLKLTLSVLNNYLNLIKFFKNSKKLLLCQNLESTSDTYFEPFSFPFFFCHLCPALLPFDVAPILCKNLVIIKTYFVNVENLSF